MALKRRIIPIKDIVADGTAIGEIHIGRVTSRAGGSRIASQANLYLKDSTVSKKHAVIRVDMSGCVGSPAKAKLTVEDQDSHHGTVVRDEWLEAFDPVPIEPGDYIGLVSPGYDLLYSRSGDPSIVSCKVLLKYDGIDRENIYFNFLDRDEIASLKVSYNESVNDGYDDLSSFNSEDYDFSELYQSPSPPSLEEDEEGDDDKVVCNEEEEEVDEEEEDDDDDDDDNNDDDDGGNKEEANETGKAVNDSEVSKYDATKGSSLYSILKDDCSSDESLQSDVLSCWGCDRDAHSSVSSTRENGLKAFSEDFKKEDDAILVNTKPSPKLKSLSIPASGKIVKLKSTKRKNSVITKNEALTGLLGFAVGVTMGAGLTFSTLASIGKSMV